MCPSGDRTATVADNELTFIMSNIIPQASLQNQNIWANFENYCRQTLLPGGRELLIICGPSGFTTNKLPSNSHISIPGYTWKIVVVVPGGTGTATNRITPTTQVITLRIPNTEAVAYDPWQNYRTNTVAIESDTGFTFFTALPPNLATVLRNKIDGQTPPAPAITGFSPTSGTANSSVTITGTNLVFTTNVTFSGTSASFAIDSTVQITATVPAGATTGPIQVMTLGGTATSSGNFTVGTAPTADLTITATHAGNFTQGDTGETYTIIVTNAGAVPSSGTVTVLDTLPSGLTATAISGSGWTTDLGTLTCTRSDALAAGTSYPAVTVTVNVASNAPASVINTATVSGGGDANPANNTATDPTTIAPSDSGGSIITLAGWDVSTLPGGVNNFGPSPLAPTTNAPNLTIVGLTRGSGIGTNATQAAARAWGGNNFVDTSSSAAITASRFASFAVAADTGFKVSYSSIARFDYRRSGTGPANGVLQCQIGSGVFLDIANLSYSVSTSTGASLGPIDLSGIPALQDVGAGTNVTFRIVNYGGGSAGTWYVFDMANTTALDFDLRGTVSPLVAPTPDLALAITHAGSFTQGDTSATYTITVTNMGTAATVGEVSVTDILPPGLTATAIGGSGWDGNPNTLTCTRSDAIAPGAGYPPITLTVSVATDAPASVTNTATVSGGGESHFANNTASDPTTINALAPIQLWRLQWYGTTANSGPAADTAIAPNGMPNLLAYALDLNPMVPTNNPVVGDIDTGYLRLTVPRNPDATDISFHVELTELLAPSSWSTNATTVETDTPALLRVRANAPVASYAGGFMRLRVSRP